MRVLVVDDNPEDRELVRRELGTEFGDLTLVAVTNADEFLAAFASGAFSAVIIEHNLGWSDGLSVLSDVKAHHPDCPVIIYTRTGS